MKIYFGYSEDSSFLKQNFQDFIDESCGKLILAIGKGRFAQELNMVLLQAMARGAKSENDIINKEFKLKKK